MFKTQETDAKTPEVKYELHNRLLCINLLKQLFDEDLINRDTYEKAVKEVK